MATMGRASIFRDKEGGDRVQGLLTQRGSLLFEWKRQELAGLYEHVLKRAPVTVSDADTIEFALRGPKETRALLRALRDEERRK